MKSVRPATYLVGHTAIHTKGLVEYLKDTGQTEFMASVNEAGAHPVKVSDPEVLSSFYAKLCYKALTTRHNLNISRVRDIPSNVVGTLQQGHGSVFEHVWFNFVTTNCSRVFTHELVRHRVGTAFSQTSGRYVRSDTLEMVLDDPILDIKTRSRGDTTIKDILAATAEGVEEAYRRIMDEVEWDSLNFDTKKKLTSALRRILPNGQANEIGWSANARALRHLIQLRTSRHAEWEIRTVFDEVFKIMQTHFPLLLDGASWTLVDGLVEVTGMKTQPY